MRARAANPAGFVKEEDGVTNAANYMISEYPIFPDADYARRALRMERKLELGMEGHRWFDLNRWGNTVDGADQGSLTMKRQCHGVVQLYRAPFTVVGPEDVTYPIPQRQIDLSNGKLVQNR